MTPSRSEKILQNGFVLPFTFLIASTSWLRHEILTFNHTTPWLSWGSIALLLFNVLLALRMFHLCFQIRRLTHEIEVTRAQIQFELWLLLLEHNFQQMNFGEQQREPNNNDGFRPPPAPLEGAD
jgi:hypothetical protein